MIKHLRLKLGIDLRLKKIKIAWVHNRNDSLSSDKFSMPFSNSSRDTRGELVKPSYQLKRWIKMVIGESKRYTTFNKNCFLMLHDAIYVSNTL